MATVTIADIMSTMNRTALLLPLPLTPPRD